MKQILKNYALTLLGWIVFDAAAFGTFFLMYIDEDIVWPAYIGGAILNIAAFCALWHFVLRKTWRGLLDIHWATGIFWWLTELAALLLSLISSAFAAFCATGLAGGISPRWAEFYCYPYYGAIIIFTVVRCIMIAIQRRKET